MYINSWLRFSKAIGRHGQLPLLTLNTNVKTCWICSNLGCWLLTFPNYWLFEWIGFISFLAVFQLYTFASQVFFPVTKRTSFALKCTKVNCDLLCYIDSSSTAGEWELKQCLVRLLLRHLSPVMAVMNSAISFVYKNKWGCDWCASFHCCMWVCCYE